MLHKIQLACAYPHIDKRVVICGEVFENSNLKHLTSILTTLVPFVHVHNCFKLYIIFGSCCFCALEKKIWDCLCVAHEFLTYITFLDLEMGCVWLVG